MGNLSRQKLPHNLRISAVMLTSAVAMVTACKPSFEPKTDTLQSGGNSNLQQPSPTPQITPPPGGSPLPTPSPVVTPIPPSPSGPSFKIESNLVNLAHDKAQYWDGCHLQSAVRGGYDSNTLCGKAYLHPRLAEHLNKYFVPCLQRAAQIAQLALPVNFFINHFGTYNDRNARGSSSLSMHAYARAIDLAFVNLFDAQGNKLIFSTHVRDYKGANKILYDNFRACWKENIPKSCRAGDSESSGSIGIPGSKLGGNDLHNDHIHLSMPLCGG